MPIISNYDPISGSGGTVTGGSFNNAPYPECFVRFVPIPDNEKFLLIPAKQESREVDVTFNQLVELYFGSEELPFKVLPIGEKYKDTQLGVDLWVKTTDPDCQCLIIIRSEKPIDYIGTVTPTPTPTPTPSPTPASWAIIAPDGLSALIDSSKFPDFETFVDASAIVSNPESIPNYQFFSDLNCRDQDGNIINSYGVSPGFYPFIGDFVTTIENYHSSINFQLTSEYEWMYLKISNFNLATNTFTLVNPPPQEWLFISPDNLTATFDGSQLTAINSWNLTPTRQVKAPGFTSPPEWNGDLSRELIAERKIRSTGQLTLASGSFEPDSIMQFELNYSFHESVKFYVRRTINVGGVISTVNSDYLKINAFNFLTNTFTLGI